MMVTSLLMRAHSEEDLECCTKGVVTLLERLSLLTELVGHREELQGLLEEAKYQVRTPLFGVPDCGCSMDIVVNVIYMSDVANLANWCIS